MTQIMSQFLAYAFHGFWPFCGAALLFTIAATLAANVTWRLAYFFVVLVRGWPEGTRNAKLDDITA